MQICASNGRGSVNIGVDEISNRPLVLYVDDDDLVAYLVERMLTRLQVCRLTDGEMALQYLNGLGPYQGAPLPDLVLLDLNLPLRDGFEVLEAIRANPVLAGLPVAIFTTSQNPRDSARAFALGADYFLPKPSSLDAFERIVDELGRIVSEHPPSCRARAS